jgi:hypothetical protein
MSARAAVVMLPTAPGCGFDLSGGLSGMGTLPEDGFVLASIPVAGLVAYAAKDTRAVGSPVPLAMS